jgi:DNA-directed RNA polymerase subunit K/omega
MSSDEEFSKKSKKKKPKKDESDDESIDDKPQVEGEAEGEPELEGESEGEVDELDLDELDLDDSDDEPINSDKCEIVTKTILVGDQRRTKDMMTSYEFASIISLRAVHLENKDCQPFVDANGRTSTKEIALEELKQKRCPLSVRRPVGPNIEEEWEANELILPDITDF